MLALVWFSLDGVPAMERATITKIKTGGLEMKKSPRCFVALVSVLILGGAAATAVAAPTMFVSSNEVLMRINPDSSIDQFTMSNPVTALSFDANGDLWATSPDTLDLYRVLDPFGTPALSTVATLSILTPSIEWVNGSLYAMESTSPGVTSRLVTLDPGTGVATPVGVTGLLANDTTPGMTVDTSTNTMYALNINSETLFTVDWLLLNGPDPVSTTVGPVGGTLNMSTTGMDYWEGESTMYAMVKNFVGGVQYDIGIYTVNTGTGELTLFRDLSNETAIRGSAAIAIIPEPASGLLMAFAGIALLRRR